jgi:anti-anti-sigma factor
MPTFEQTGLRVPHAQAPPAAAHAADRLTLHTEWHNATDVRISASGAVDASNSDRLAQYVFRYAANCERLILDLTEVTFFGFESFSHLRLISDRCATASVTLTLIPSAVVARVLQICDPHRALLPPEFDAKLRAKAC